jgi:hypothetical protein
VLLPLSIRHFLYFLIFFISYSFVFPIFSFYFFYLIPFYFFILLCLTSFSILHGHSSLCRVWVSFSKLELPLLRDHGSTFWNGPHGFLHLFRQCIGCSKLKVNMVSLAREGVMIMTSDDNLGWGLSSCRRLCATCGWTEQPRCTTRSRCTIFIHVLTSKDPWPSSWQACHHDLEKSLSS